MTAPERTALRSAAAEPRAEGEADRSSFPWIQRYDLPFPELPQLVHLARLTISKDSERTMAAHTHDVLELHYMESGGVRWWCEDDVHDLIGGDAYVVRPGEIHGGMLTTSTHYTLWLRPPAFGERYFDLPSEEAAALAGALAHPLARTGRIEQPLGPSFEALATLAERRQKGDSDPMLGLEARALVLLVLTCIGKSIRSTAPSKQLPPFAAQVVEIMDANLGNPLSAPELANRLGCSVSQLQHRFQAELGTTVKRYYQWRRINEACRRLEHTSDRITDISYELGFSSSQHFATNFRRFVGASPRAYRQGARLPLDNDPWPEELHGHTPMQPLRGIQAQTDGHQEAVSEGDFEGEGEE